MGLTIWTDEQVAALKTRWAAGDSASMIARDSGRTRNAVLGKLGRLGLLGTRQKLQGNRPAQLRRAPPTKARRQTKQPPAWVRVVESPPAEDHNVTLMDLRSHHCRWPLSDGAPWLFCGAPQLEPHSYCLAHCRMAYRTRAEARLEMAERKAA